MNNADFPLLPSSNMSWFVVSAILVGLWKYDRCLLDKLERWVWKKGSSAAWFLLELYTKYKDKNEMIKDGYHVDTVYLFEHRSPLDSSKFDVLSVFRREIVKETFTNKKGIQFVDFLRLCSESGSNFKYDANLTYELEVNYTFDRKQYKIFYSNDKNNEIKFPVYSESEMAKADVDNSIISAEIVRDDIGKGGIDIGDVILKYAGPKGNFYDDSDFVVLKSWLKYSGIDEESKISIMDIEGNTFEFNDEDKYLTLNNTLQSDNE